MARKKSSMAGDKVIAAIVTAILAIVAAIIAALTPAVKRLFQKTSEANQETIQLPTAGRFAFEVVGESNYQKALEKICGGRTEDSAEKMVTARLVLEDNNPYDDQAVRVDIEGAVVGYLAKQNARKYRDFLRRGGHGKVIGTCEAKIIGGWERAHDDRGSFGVKLNLSLK